MAESIYIGSVWASFDLKVDDFNDGVGKAAGGLGNLKTTALGVFGGNLLTQGVQAVTSALVGFGKSAITSAADLESGMNLLQAVTGATGEQMRGLSKRAVDLGNDITLPGVAASDAADAMIELGKAGLGVNDIMGASKAVLQSAKAGNIGVAEAANITANAMNAFGISGDRAIEVADTLAAAANASSLEIPGIADGLRQAGAQAKLSGLSLQETVGIIAQLSNKGLDGARAGTSLSYMLRQLQAPTEKSAELMKELGINVFDAQGKFVGYRKSVELLRTKLGPLNDEQKANALNTIFGAEAMKAVSILTEEGAAGFDKMTAAVSKQGAAQDLAAARSKGFNGVIEALKNQMDTLATTIGLKLLGPLTKIGQWISDNFMPLLGAVGGALVGLGVYFGITGVAALGLSGILAGLGTALGVVVGVLTSPITLLVALGAALAFLQVKFNIFGKAWDWIKEKIQPFMPIIKAITDFMKGQFASIWTSLKSIFKQFMDSFQPLIDMFKEFWSKHGSKVITVLKIIGIAVGAVLAVFVLGPIVAFMAVLKILAVVLKFIADHFEGIKKIVLTVLAVAFAPLIIAIVAVVAAVKLIIIIIKALVAAFKWIVNAVGTIIEWFGKAYNAVAGAVKAIASTIKSVFTAIAGFLKTVMTVIWNIIKWPIALFLALVITYFTAVFNFWKFIFTAIWNFVTTVFTAIWTTITTILTAIWNTIVTIWNTIWSVVQPILQAIWNGIVSVFTTVRDAIANAMNAIWNVIVSVWNTVFGFISTVLTAVWTFIVNIWNTIFAAVSGALSAVWNVVSSVFNSVWNVISTVWNRIYSTISGIVGKVAGVIGSIKDKVVSAVSGAGSWLLDAGKNVVEGLINGIKSMGGKLLSAITNFIKDKLPGPVKKVLGISSPSKLFKSFGVFTIQGLQIGIEKTANKAVGAVEKVSNRVADAFNPATSFNSLQVPSVRTNAGQSLSSQLSPADGIASQAGEVNIYGDINDKSDAEYIMNTLSRRQGLAGRGMITV